MDITKRQQVVLDALEEFIDANGYAPSVRELGKLAKLKSPASVQYHLNKLEESGHIFRPDGKFRAIKLLNTRDSNPVDEDAIAKFLEGGPHFGDSPSGDAPAAISVPLVGSVAAGTGVIAEEHIEEMMILPTELAGSGDLFVLEVRGDSMRDAAILDGDWVVVRSQSDAENGDIVVAAVGKEEATVKRLQKQGSQIILEPANEEFQPICIQAHEAVIYGKVLSVMRRL